MKGFAPLLAVAALTVAACASTTATQVLVKTDDADAAARHFQAGALPRLAAAHEAGILKGADWNRVKATEAKVDADLVKAEQFIDAGNLAAATPLVQDAMNLLANLK